MREVRPFILCGGAGTRLWPLSREAYPKQFHKLTGHDTLLQQTCRRLHADLFAPLSVLGSQRYRFLIAEQLAAIGIKPNNIVLEPATRNTAPAACIAALLAYDADPDSLVLLAPSDHMIGDARAFATAVKTGIEAAEHDALVTFGATPDHPHTGYGYIETDGLDHDALRVTRFIEKPSFDSAKSFVDSGRYYWNAGIFLFKSGLLLNLFEIHAPDILGACRRSLTEASKDLSFLVLNGAYAQAPAISLDYAVAEKTDGMRCIPLKTPWTDVGSWSAVWNFIDKDEAGNVAKGDGEVIFKDTHNSFVFSDRPCTALVGLDNVVVVAMDDAVLVTSRDQSESIKSVVDYVKETKPELAAQHNRVYRPWGWYQTLNRGTRYQVKCIMVKPGAKLSLQSHHHRSEHWVVVSGTLEVTKDDKLELLSENQSTYIPTGQKHRLANPGKIPAFLIEVQSGPYLGEDDIVRFEDIYRRSLDE
jgi:mannose-1-phosphate guanylyltransferase/mannose-6-phosphate isomerase